MRYVVKQKLFRFVETYLVMDEADKERFLMKGAFLSLSHQVSIEDMAGKKLALVRQRLWSWGPNFEVMRGGEQWAVIKATTSTFSKYEFAVIIPGTEGLVAKGDFLKHEFDFFRLERPVATLTKRWPTLVDAYSIEMNDEEDPVLILACTYAIAAVYRE